MTINKNQHRKDIARIVTLVFLGIGGLESAAMAQVREETKANPSVASFQRGRLRERQSQLVEMDQMAKARISNGVEIKFVPQEPLATKFLAEKVDVFVSDDRAKVSMTNEAALHEYLKQFDRAMTEAKKLNVDRDKPFPDVSTKVTAKAFDEAVRRADLAMSRYRLLQTRLKNKLLNSFGDLRDLVSKEDMKLSVQGAGPRVGTVAELLARMDLGYSNVEIEAVGRGGARHQFEELQLVQKDMLKSGVWDEPTVQPKTYLSRNLDIIRQVETTGVEVSRKATLVDVANFDRMAADHKEALKMLKARQPIALQVQRAFDKIPRSQLPGGRVTLLVGAAGFVASGAVVAGEAEAVESQPAEGSAAEFTSQSWARPARRTSR